MQKFVKKIENPKFWEKKSEAEKIIKEKKLYEDLINSFQSSSNECSDLYDLYKLAEEEGNINVIDETLKNLKRLFTKNMKN